MSQTTAKSGRGKIAGGGLAVAKVAEASFKIDFSAGCCLALKGRDKLHVSRPAELADGLDP